MFGNVHLKRNNTFTELLLSNIIYHKKKNMFRYKFIFLMKSAVYELKFI